MGCNQWLLCGVDAEAATDCVAGRGTKGKKKAGGKLIAKDEDSDIFKVVKMLMEHQYDPVRAEGRIASHNLWCHMQSLFQAGSGADHVRRKKRCLNAMCNLNFSVTCSPEALTHSRM